jgi:hypothetical protein
VHAQWDLFCDDELLVVLFAEGAFAVEEFLSFIQKNV